MTIQKIIKHNHLLLAKLPEIKGKIKVMQFLSNYISERKNYKKFKILIRKIYIERMKRKCFKGLKLNTLLEKTKVYEERIKQKTENELKGIQENLIQKKEELLGLISKAEEKLKHENRKKVQTKLKLDQMVLRGISDLNLKAITLSQSSLNDVMKTDYAKTIDKKYNAMLFPETKSTLTQNQKKK